MADISDQDREQLLIMALDELARSGVTGFDVRRIAQQAQLDLASALELAGTPETVLHSLARHLDRKMVKTGSLEETEELSIREQLFELLMQRFDAMAPFKSGLRALAEDQRGDPLLSLRSLCNLDRSAAWMLAAAGVSASGPLGTLRRMAMAQAYARVVRVWLRDDTPDLGATMAELDKRLAELEDWASGMARFTRSDRRGSWRSDPPPATAPEPGPTPGSGPDANGEAPVVG